MGKIPIKYPTTKCKTFVDEEVNSSAVFTIKFSMEGVQTVVQTGSWFTCFSLNHNISPDHMSRNQINPYRK
jgi:hypothetical protein